MKSALAKQFGVFNKFFTAVPSASTPNHLMAQSATSCGIVDNIIYSDCGGSTATFPQFTIYDSLFVEQVDFRLYMNSTCGLPYPNGTKRPPCHNEDPPDTPGAGSTIYAPDVGMAGVGRHADKFASQEHFYEAAAAGDLPALSWLLPPFQACDHPCYDVAKGERLLKDVYEALRAGPGWDRTLLLVVYDDAGGYYDHVVPPFEGVPADDAPCVATATSGPHKDQCPGPYGNFSTRANAFDFKRLGLRTTALLVSPFVPPGTVFQEPKGPTNTSQFDLTSIPATTRNLFNLSGFLTKRDEWAGSFDELLTNEASNVGPMHLPEPPAPHDPWTPPPDLLDTQDDVRASHQATPQHCSHADGVCRGPDVMTVKQRKTMVLLSKYLDIPFPDDLYSKDHADHWISTKWQAWLDAGAPLA